MNRNRRFYIDVFLIALSDFIWPLGYNMYINFFPIHIRQLGGNDYIVSLITSIPWFLGILAIPGGILSDLVDRKKIMVFGWAVTIPAPLIWAYADRWEWLLVGQFIYGMTLVCMPTITLYIFDYKSTGNKMLAYSIVIIGGTAGSILAPALGGRILNTFGTRTLYLTVFFLFTISSICIMFISKQQVENKKKLSQCLKWDSIKGSYPVKKLTIIALFLSLLSMVQSIADPYLALYLSEAKQISVGLIGVAFTILAVGAALFTWFYGKSDGKIYIHYSVLAGVSVFLMSIILIVLAGNEYILLSAFFLRGTNRSLLSYIQGVFTSSLTGDNKGIILAFFMSVRSIFIGLAAFLGAFLYRTNPLLPFFAEGILTILWALISFHGYFRNYWRNCSFEKTAL